MTVTFTTVRIADAGIPAQPGDREIFFVQANAGEPFSGGTIKPNLVELTVEHRRA